MFDFFNQKSKPKTSSLLNKPIAFSMGDPAGIGSECLLKTWVQRTQKNLPVFFVVGDPDDYAQQVKINHLNVPIKMISSPEQANNVFATALPVYPLKLKTPSKMGVAEPANAAMVLESIKQATQFVLKGDAAALVTLPIHKSTLYQSGFAFPGHTEYLASLCQTTRPCVMMLETLLPDPLLRVALITVHVSLKEAIEKLSPTLIISNVLTLEKALRTMFGIKKPRFIIAGLNPHAGEQGALGLEEIECIRPAVEQLIERGIDIRGPHPADTMFHATMRQSYDCAICLYHDQGLIPLKTLDFHGGVNITLGLPIIRTSPDHGTAFDIAGKNCASPQSVISALLRAQQLVIAQLALSAAISDKSS